MCLCPALKATLKKVQKPALLSLCWRILKLLKYTSRLKSNRAILVVGVDCCDEKLRVLINDAYDLLSAEKSDIIPDDETAAKVI